MESHSPVGKLIRPLRDEDVAERDGEHGRPLWITLGQDVFNITGTSSVNRYTQDFLPLVTDPSPEAFPFESMNQRIMLRSNPGANPMHAIDEDDTVTADQVVEYLWPYRCATLAEPRPVQGPQASSENLYTRKEVAWHTYRETGMYTIIRDNVYDMTGRLSALLCRDLLPAATFCINDNIEFVEYHPGGTTLIERFAGKDSTDAFNRYHRDAERCLADYDFLRIGRVIREGRHPIANNQIIVHGMAYDLTREYSVDRSTTLADLSTVSDTCLGVHRDQ